jgi:hypothetical protein
MNNDARFRAALSKFIGMEITPDLIDDVLREAHPARAPRKVISQIRLKELLTYDPVTGLFRWRVQPMNGGSVRVGDVAGSCAHHGYIRIKLDGKYYYAHRLAWLYVHGCLPSKVDHINCDPGENWIDNLRPATNSQSGANRKKNKNNTSGFRGVSYDKKKSAFAANIYIDRKKRFLGYAKTAEEAHAIYVSGARTLFGEFANPG